MYLVNELLVLAGLELHESNVHVRVQHDNPRLAHRCYKAWAENKESTNCHCIE